MHFTRREFLIGASALGVVSGRAFPLPQVIHAGAENGKVERLEQSLMTLCGQCPGGCGLRVRVVDGRVVGIAGNPAHPINQGGVCARAPAAAQSLYNPDRLRQPAVLAGPKGSGRYLPIEWPEAVQRLAERLQNVRHKPGPHSVAVVTNGDRGLTRLLWSRFLQAYGSNNLLDLAGAEGHRDYPAAWAMQGLRQGTGYDLAHARYVLSFGSQLLDAHWSPAQASHSFAALRAGRGAARAKLVHIEPRLSLTGAKADEWIPCLPGTEGAVALAIAHVLLREGLYDSDFVAQHTHGFEDPAAEGPEERIGFRRLVLRDYAPWRVARISGVEEGTIFRLAREFATHRPALALGFDGSGVSTQRSYDRMAIHALNALVGSIDVPGGVTHFQEIPLLPGPSPELDAAAEQGLARPAVSATDPSVFPLGNFPPHLLAQRILADVPYPIEVLVLAGANLVFNSPDPEQMKRALAKVPFVVSLSPWLDDSAQWADLIIPDSHFLTRWDLDVCHTLTGKPVVSIGRPVVSGDQAEGGSADLALKVARQLGGNMAEALPYENTQAVVRAVCDNLYAMGRGGPFGAAGEIGWTQLLERSGWRAPPAATAEDFCRKVVSGGGWLDPIYYHNEWDRVLKAPPRQFAFHSAVIAGHIQPRAMQDDIRCLPHYEEVLPPDSDGAFPYQLYVYPLAVLAGLKDVNLPWLMNAVRNYSPDRQHMTMEINPSTARQLHVVDGDTVVVASVRGKMRVKVKLFEGIMPEVVAIPWGLGHEGGGRWSDGIGRNPNAMIRVSTDPLTAGPFWQATRVSIQKI